MQPPADLLDLDLSEILADLSDVELGVDHAMGMVRLGMADPRGGVAILVPDTDPRLVEIQWETDGAILKELLAIAPGHTVTRKVGDGTLRLRTARGMVYELETRTELPVVELLARTELFRSLDRRSLTLLAGRATHRVLPRGSIIFWQDELAERLFVLAEGEVKLFITTRDGDQLELSRLRPPDVFGQFELWDGGPRFVSAEAVEATRVLVLARDDLFRLLRTESDFIEGLLRSACATIRQTTRQLSDLAFLSLQGRVAAKLLDLAEPGQALTRRISQVELATMVGGARQTVNQALRSLEARGYIRSAGRAFEILDREQLRRLAGG